MDNKSTSCCSPAVVVLLLSLEHYIIQLLCGTISHIYLNIRRYSDGYALELSSIKNDEGIEVFDYNTLGRRYKNKAFLYLYLVDAVDDLLCGVQGE